MSDKWLRRLGWVTAVFSLLILTLSIIIFWLAPGQNNPVWQYVQVKTISDLGAPVLGLLILHKQPRQRIGWLWIIYGLAAGLGSLGHAIYFYGGFQPTGYSALEYFLLWVTQPANITNLICLILLILWFPDGQLASRRWRFLYVWLFLAVAAIGYAWFTAGPNWNGGESAGGIVIENPYGWLPEVTHFYFGFSGFISILLITILALAALVLRYRAAGQVVRLQLRWFVFGGVIHVILNFTPALLGYNSETMETWRWLYMLGATAVVPLYLAVGIAILRYRLYDIDVIIRKTLQYGVLSALLALVYFGMVILLQSVFNSVSGQQSPIAIVITTLVIAALFAPLRRRIQDVIDRRFYRKKYDAQQVLAQFAITARDETDMDKLTNELIRVVQETMQPESVSIWLKEFKRDASYE